MEFVALYPNVVPEDRVIENVVALLSDEEYQAGALAWAGQGMTLAPYALVSESAVYREDTPVPSLLIRDVVVDGLEDNGQGVKGVFRFAVYQMLATLATDRESSDALMREAYRRNRAVEAMLKTKAAHAAIFEGVNVGGRAKVLITRREPGETMPGKASYLRFPSVSVAINFTEGP